jgi:hypothetical protein
VVTREWTDKKDMHALRDNPSRHLICAGKREIFIAMGWQKIHRGRITGEISARSITCGIGIQDKRPSNQATVLNRSQRPFFLLNVLYCTVSL